jgi:hypothetical protein
VVTTCPWYDEIPKDLKANLAWRLRALCWGAASASDAAAFQAMCRVDLLFYVNGFCWTYNPRVKPSILPFITWDYQDDVLMQIKDHIVRGEDLLLEKSRDMGGTWLPLMVMDWMGRYEDCLSFLLASRKEELVDKRGDKKTLFAKLDFNLKYQPPWFRPAIRLGTERTERHLLYPATDSAIDGESTTGDLARGDRRTAIMLDELPFVPNGEEVMSATADATDCRIMVGTPKGRANVFYDRKTGGTTTISLHWSMHPTKAAGLEEDKDYRGGNPWGRFTSPWYRNECVRRGNPQEIAQELDLDYHGSDFPFFGADVLERILGPGGDVLDPLVRGEIVYDRLTPGAGEVSFQANPDGRLLLWRRPDGEGNLPIGTEYGLAADVAAGTKDQSDRGFSNSVLALGDLKRRELIGEFAVSGFDPIEFAHYAVALARWAKGSSGSGATMIWEDNGPGGTFGGRVVNECGYGRVYRRAQSGVLAHRGLSPPGWWSTPSGKQTLLEEYRYALNVAEMVNRSRRSVEECAEYKYSLTGDQVVHAHAAVTTDPTGARHSHGDRVIAAALLWRIMKSRGGSQESKTVKVPYGSLAHRMLEVADARRAGKCVY